MNAPTFTKTGAKASVAHKLDKDVFGVMPENHQLLKTAYLAYLANGRVNLAKTLKRGEVRGGGRKPWRQKGTGRARFGSIRNPIWRGGGITFGPQGNENYRISIPTKAKRLAIKQALSLKTAENKVIVTESLSAIETKTKQASDYIKKLNLNGNILIVVDSRDLSKERGVNNLQGIKVVSAKYLNVYDILNSDFILTTKPALEIISEWLNSVKAEAK